MKKEVITIVDICDGCQAYPVRYACEECKKTVCHNCVRSFTGFHRRVKSTNLNTIYFCPECVKKDTASLVQLRRIAQLREEWYSSATKYLLDATTRGSFGRS